MTLDEGCRVATHALQMQTLADCNRIGALSDPGSAGYRRGMVINARKNKLLEDCTCRTQWMTLSQLIEQTRIERDKTAVQLRNLDAALGALTKIDTAPGAPRTKFGRTWTPEQRAKLSASLKKVFAAKKAGRKAISKPKV